MVKNPIKASIAQDFPLMKIAVTKPHRKSVLALRRAKTSALDWMGGVGLSAIGGESKTDQAGVATHSIRSRATFFSKRGLMAGQVPKTGV